MESKKENLNQRLTPSTGNIVTKHSANWHPTLPENELVKLEDMRLKLRHLSSDNSECSRVHWVVLCEPRHE